MISCRKGAIKITVKDVLDKIAQENHSTTHKIMDNPVKLLDDDWIRIYEGRNCIIDNMIFSCDYKDRNTIPDDILNVKIDLHNNWFVGGILSIDCIVLTR